MKISNNFFTSKFLEITDKKFLKKTVRAKQVPFADKESSKPYIKESQWEINYSGNLQRKLKMFKK